MTFGNPYSAFLAEQKKREVEWATNRANKKAKCTATTEKDLEAVKQQLAAKEAECKTLKGQLDNIQLANVSVVEAVHNKVQESVCKVSTLINVSQKWMKKHCKNTIVSFSTSKMSI